MKTCCPRVWPRGKGSWISLLVFIIIICCVFPRIYGQGLLAVNGNTQFAKPVRGPHACGSGCCPGWSQYRQQGPCLKPLCNSPCNAGGQCIRPNLCLCGDGHTASACGASHSHGRPRLTCHDLNCDQKCMVIDGAPVCTCMKGFILAEDGKKCTDYDECALEWCQQDCKNTHGSYICSCRAGYKLAGNGHACQRVGGRPTGEIDLRGTGRGASESPGGRELRLQCKNCRPAIDKVKVNVHSQVTQITEEKSDVQEEPKRKTIKIRARPSRWEEKTQTQKGTSAFSQPQTGSSKPSIQMGKPSIKVKKFKNREFTLVNGNSRMRQLHVETEVKNPAASTETESVSYSVNPYQQRVRSQPESRQRVRYGQNGNRDGYMRGQVNGKSYQTSQGETDRRHYQISPGHQISGGRGDRGYQVSQGQRNGGGYQISQGQTDGRGYQISQGQTDDRGYRISQRQTDDRGYRISQGNQDQDLFRLEQTRRRQSVNPYHDTDSAVFPNQPTNIKYDVNGYELRQPQYRENRERINRARGQDYMGNRQGTGQQGHINQRYWQYHAKLNQQRGTYPSGYMSERQRIQYVNGESSNYNTQGRGQYPSRSQSQGSNNRYLSRPNQGLTNNQRHWQQKNNGQNIRNLQRQDFNMGRHRAYGPGMKTSHNPVAGYGIHRYAGNYGDPRILKSLSAPLPPNPNGRPTSYGIHSYPGNYQDPNVLNQQNFDGALQDGTGHKNSPLSNPGPGMGRHPSFWGFATKTLRKEHLDQKDTALARVEHSDTNDSVSSVNTTKNTIAEATIYSNLEEKNITNDNGTKSLKSSHEMIVKKKGKADKKITLISAEEFVQSSSGDIPQRPLNLLKANVEGTHERHSEGVLQNDFDGDHLFPARDTLGKKVRSDGRISARLEYVNVKRNVKHGSDPSNIGESGPFYERRAPTGHETVGIYKRGKGKATVLRARLEYVDEDQKRKNKNIMPEYGSSSPQRRPSHPVPPGHETIGVYKRGKGKLAIVHARLEYVDKSTTDPSRVTSTSSTPPRTIKSIPHSYPAPNIYHGGNTGGKPWQPGPGPWPGQGGRGQSGHCIGQNCWLYPGSPCQGGVCSKQSGQASPPCLGGSCGMSPVQQIPCVNGGNCAGGSPCVGGNCGHQPPPCTDGTCGHGLNSPPCVGNNCGGAQGIPCSGGNCGQVREHPLPCTSGSNCGGTPPGNTPLCPPNSNCIQQPGQSMPCSGVNCGLPQPCTSGNCGNSGQQQSYPWQPVQSQPYGPCPATGCDWSHHPVHQTYPVNPPQTPPKHGSTVVKPCVAGKCNNGNTGMGTHQATGHVQQKSQSGQPVWNQGMLPQTNANHGVHSGKINYNAGLNPQEPNWQQSQTGKGSYSKPSGPSRDQFPGYPSWNLGVHASQFNRNSGQYPAQPQWNQGSYPGRLVPNQRTYPGQPPWSQGSFQAYPNHNQRFNPGQQNFPRHTYSGNPSQNYGQNPGHFSPNFDPNPGFNPASAGQNINPNSDNYKSNRGQHLGSNQGSKLDPSQGSSPSQNKGTPPAQHGGQQHSTVKVRGPVQTEQGPCPPDHIAIKTATGYWCEYSRPGPPDSTAIPENSKPTSSASCPPDYTAVETPIGVGCRRKLTPDGCEVACTNGGICRNGTCICPRGITGKSCQTDIDECRLKGPGYCQYECQNTFGSFQCLCPSAFTLNSDRRTCKAIGCIPDCMNGGTCVQGRCVCPAGFTGQICQSDVNECVSRPGLCQKYCRNTIGSYMCLCPAGSRLAADGRTCLDSRCIPDCRNGGTCLSNRCKCSPGFYGIVCQLDVNECRHFRPCSHDCHNTRGSYYCSCPRGFSLGGDQRTCANATEIAALEVRPERPLPPYREVRP